MYDYYDILNFNYELNLKLDIIDAELFIISFYLDNVLIQQLSDVLIRDLYRELRIDFIDLII